MNVLILMGKSRTGSILICKNCLKEFYVRLSLVNIQKYCSLKCRPSVWNKGLTKNDPRVLKNIIKIALARKGKHASIKTEFKPGDKRISGKNHWNWRGGISKVNKSERNNYYSLGITKKWIKEVFKRDKYTCKFCGQKGGKLNADHIKPWSLFPELRFDLNNGQTLCISCHKIKSREELKKNWSNQYGHA